MINLRFFALLAVVTLAAGGCTRAAQVTAPEISPSPAQTEEGEVLTLQMQARNDSGQDGTAMLIAIPDGTTSVSIELDNFPSGPQPSHINSGTCDDLGEIAHILGGMRSGRIQATVDVPIADLLEGQFAISIAKSPQEFSVTVSCADITE